MLLGRCRASLQCGGNLIGLVIRRMNWQPLSARTALVYALDRGLLPDGALTDPSLLVRARYGRNSVFVIETTHSSICLKQDRQGKGGAGALAREAELLGLLAGSGLTVRAQTWDADLGVLCLETLPADTNVDAYGPEAEADLACVLQALHAQPAPSGYNAVLPPLTDRRFWEDIAHRAPLFDELARRDEDLKINCLTATRFFKSSAFIHGDAKMLNGMRDAHGRMVLIDLELAGGGEPIWDLACLVADVLALQFASAPVGTTQAALTQRATERARAVCTAYAPGTGLDATAAGTMIALACLSAAHAHLADSEVLTRGALVLMQLGQNGMRDPAVLWNALHA